MALLVPLHTLHSVGHLGPAIGMFVMLLLGFLVVLWTVFAPWFASFIPLEILHMPRWFRCFMAIGFFSYGPVLFPWRYGGQVPRGGGAARGNAAPRRWIPTP
jgi:hypothetical protein